MNFDSRQLIGLGLLAVAAAVALAFGVRAWWLNHRDDDSPADWENAPTPPRDIERAPGQQGGSAAGGARPASAQPPARAPEWQPAAGDQLARWASGPHRRPELEAPVPAYDHLWLARQLAGHDRWVSTAGARIDQMAANPERFGLEPTIGLDVITAGLAVPA